MPGSPVLRSYQSYIENYRYPVLAALRSEIEAAADLFLHESEEEEKITALLHRIKCGGYSDLNPSSTLSDQLRPYPAYDGVHVNETHL